MLLEDTPATARDDAALRALGVRLLLDDFGTGYSSLRYLRRYPIDGLKVDRSFVAGLGEDGDGDAAIVQAIVGMARALGMRVVAEGVETEGQLERLRALGCDLAQGFLLSRPLPAAEIEACCGAAAERVALSEVLGALSYALDLTEGEPPGHAVRTLPDRDAARRAARARRRRALGAVLRAAAQGRRLLGQRLAAVARCSAPTTRRRSAAMKRVDWTPLRRARALHVARGRARRLAAGEGARGCARSRRRTRSRAS